MSENFLAIRDALAERNIEKTKNVLQKVWNDKKFVAELNEGGRYFLVYLRDRLEDAKVFPFTDEEFKRDCEFLNLNALASLEEAAHPDPKTHTLKELHDEIEKAAEAYMNRISKVPQKKQTAKLWSPAPSLAKQEQPKNT